MKKLYAKVLLTLALSCAALSPHHQIEAVLASVKSTGMAATCIAYPQDSLVAAYNPAGITDVGDRLDLGVVGARDRGRAKISGNIIPGIDGSFNPYKTQHFCSPDFGFTKQITCNQAIGLVIYNRNFSKTTYDTNFPLFGTSDLSLEYLHETISPTYAIYLGRGHSLGISGNFMFQRFKLKGLETIAASPILSSSPNNVTNKGYSHAYGFGVTLGWKWQALDNLAVGLSFQPRTHMSRFKKYRGFIANHGRIDIPQKIGGGIAWNPTCDWTLCFDLEHIRWSGVKPLHNPLLPNLVTNQLGTSGGAGFGFRNQTYYRFGTDYRITDNFTLRAGYRFTQALIRRSQTAVNLLTDDVCKSFLTVGGTFFFEWFCCCHEISAFYAHGFKHTVKGKNSIPPGLPPLGFGGGEVDLEQSKNALGVSWGINF